MIRIVNEHACDMPGCENTSTDPVAEKTAHNGCTDYNTPIPELWAWVSIVRAHITHAGVALVCPACVAVLFTVGRGNQQQKATSI
ncbi:hypothetical protein LCGC14_2778030 [marine sediment metagenome]|uniref:Uncharacterized protein n=1 Tax=marine sediment metagenome TaxID=412755 RepID=A0A0F9BKS1_9ZZZZ